LSSVLEAPQEPGGNNGEFSYQICISWKLHDDPLKENGIPKGVPNQADRVRIIRDMVHEWAEPFRSFVLLITDTTDVKQLDLDDCAPRNAMRSADRVMLVGDAFHAMTMCKPPPMADKHRISRIAAKFPFQIEAKVPITQ
jgi:hypothetical protein